MTNKTITYFDTHKPVSVSLDTHVKLNKIMHRYEMRNLNQVVTALVKLEKQFKPELIKISQSIKTHGK